MSGIKNVSEEQSKQYENIIKSMDTDNNGIVGYIGNF